MNHTTLKWSGKLYLKTKLTILNIMSKIIKINGVAYDPLDDRITKDYYTKEYILLDEADIIRLNIRLGRDTGYDGSTEDAYVDRRNTHKYINEGSIKILVTRFGQVYVDKDVKIGNGSGRIFQSTDPDHPEFIYDNYTNPRMNVHNKFRAFNNQVYAFKDFGSKFIPDKDKKLLLQRNYDFGVDSATYKMFEGLDYTFGVEMETSSGRLSEVEAHGLNLKCEFDGSLRENPDQRKEDVLGGEYITGVLKGDAGMYQLQKIANKLSEKCTINAKCGVHVHVGGIKLNKENIIYLYKLGEILQQEFYEMLPTSRRNNSYCRKIKTLGLNLEELNNTKTALGYDILINEYYNKIFKEVSFGKNGPSRSSNKSSNHPMGSKCGYNKDTQRYCWLNFVTAMFNTKGNKDAMTLEFRSHHGTLNYKKIKCWVKICMAFVAFAENHKRSIKRGYWLDKDKNEHEITLSTVIKAVYPKTYKLLVNYIEERKQRFFADQGDIEKLEYETDKEGVKQTTLKEDIQCAL